MKRIFLLICLAFFLSITSVAQATMNEYKNPSFDFSKVKNILLLDTETDTTKRGTIANDFADRQIDQMLAEALERRGVRFTYVSQAVKTFDLTSEKPYDVLVTERGQDEAEAIFYAWAAKYYDAYLTPQIVLYRSPTHRIPSYVTTRTVMEQTKVYDNKGNYTVVETPRTYYETVPERYYRSSDIIINFSVSSFTDNNEIYVLKDDRRRDEENAFDGMMKRICENFAKKVVDVMPNTKIK